MTAPDRVMIFDLDTGRAAKIAATLAAAGLTPGQCHQSIEAADALRRDRPAVAVVVEGGNLDPSGPGLSFPGLRETSRSFGVPTLAVIEPGADPQPLIDRIRPYDGWVALAEVDRELPARVIGLLGGGSNRKVPSIDPRFLALVVHDLRTPLNVIGLTIRAIAQSVPERNAELDEDLTFLHENARQIEKMLAQLGDYCRLIEGESTPSTVEFEPRRFLVDFLEERQGRPPGFEVVPVRLEIADDCPAEVSLDANRVRMALQHALANAINAAGESPVKIRSRGGAGRWTVEIIVDKSPPAMVASVQLRPGLFERLTGSAAERRGLDLAIAARVSELFGGSARLEIEPGQRSTIVLDWPDRLVQL